MGVTAGTGHLEEQHPALLSKSYDHTAPSLSPLKTQQRSPWKVYEMEERPASPLLILPTGPSMSGDSMPFAVTQKCFPASVSKGWDPGTHVAKLELPAALGSCRRLQKA